MYIVEVAGAHTYFMSGAKVWVHNACVPAAAKKSTLSFQSRAKQFTKPDQAVPDYALCEMVDTARNLGLRVRGPELGDAGVYRGIWHIHLGGLHIPRHPSFMP